MPDKQAIEPAGAAAALLIGAVCCLVALAVGLNSLVRWGGRVDLAPGVPSPRYASVLETQRIEESSPVGEGRPTCVLVLELPGEGVTALESYGERLAARGWQPRPDRDSPVPTLNFRAGDRRLSVALVERPYPSWSRWRLRLRPCDP